MKPVTEEQQRPEPPAESAGRPWLRLPPGMTQRQAWNLAAFAVLGVIGALLFDFLLSHLVHIQPRAVQQQVDRVGAWAPLVYVAALAITVIVTPIPSLPLDIAGGLAFGLWGGTAYILIASMLGATADFYVARIFGRGFLVRHLKPSTMSVIDGLAERIGGKAIVVMRIEPLFNFKWVSYAAGLTSMGYWVYGVATALGSFLPALGIAYVGDTLFTNPGRSALVLSLLSLTAVVPIAAAVVIGASAFVVRRGRRT